MPGGFAVPVRWANRPASLSRSSASSASIRPVSSGNLPSMQPVSKLERRVVNAAEQALARQRYVSPLDVLTGMGWLPPGRVTDWRQGRAPHLEAIAVVSADRLVDALDFFHRWV